MTSMQIALAHMPIGWPTRSIAELAEAIDEALREEREFCAKTVDARRKEYHLRYARSQSEVHKHKHDACKEVADMIRSLP